MDKFSAEGAKHKDDPELIAAAILHETGHILYNVSQFAGVLEHVDVVDQLVHTLDSVVLDKKDVSAALDAALVSLGKLKSTSDIVDLIGAIKRVQSDIEADGSPTILDVGIYLLRQSAYILYANNLMGVFDSVTDAGAMHSTETERRADEFAAQCGAGAALAKLLAIFHKGALLFDPTKVYSLQSTVLFATSLTAVFKAAFDISPCLVVSDYDIIEKRLRLLSDSVQRSTSSADISADQREEYLKVLGETDAVIEEFTSTKYIAMRNMLFALYKTLARLGVAKTLPALYAQLSHGRQMQDYVQHLFKTPMHSYTGRLESIANAR